MHLRITRSAVFGKSLEKLTDDLPVESKQVELLGQVNV